MLVECIAFHHKPLKAPNFKREAAIIHLGDYISQNCHFGSSGESKPSPLDPGIWKLLGLDAKILETLSKELFENFESVLKMFRE